MKNQFICFTILSLFMMGCLEGGSPNDRYYPPDQHYGKTPPTDVPPNYFTPNESICQMTWPRSENNINIGCGISMGPFYTEAVEVKSEEELVAAFSKSSDAPRIIFIGGPISVKSNLVVTSNTHFAITSEDAKLIFLEGAKVILESQSYGELCKDSFDYKVSVRLSVPTVSLKISSSQKVQVILTEPSEGKIDMEFSAGDSMIVFRDHTYIYSMVSSSKNRVVGINASLDQNGLQDKGEYLRPETLLYNSKLSEAGKMFFSEICSDWESVELNGQVNNYNKERFEEEMDSTCSIHEWKTMSNKWLQCS